MRRVWGGKVISLANALLVLLLAAGCASTSGEQGTADGGNSSDAIDAGSPDSPNTPSSRRTYYFNVKDPQADNLACNGRYRQTQPSGPPDCPFKDFTAQETAIWFWVKDLTIVVEPGTYRVEQFCKAEAEGGKACTTKPPDPAAPLEGTDCADHWAWVGIYLAAQEDTEQSDNVVFRADGEVILDGGHCTHYCCTDWIDLLKSQGEITAEDHARYYGQVIHLVDVLGGGHTELSGFKLTRALYHQLAWGAGRGKIHGNEFHATAIEDGDLLKGTGGSEVEVYDNLFDGFSDQAIDIAGSNHNWHVHDNTFQNGTNAAIGTKVGTTGLLFENNIVRDLQNVETGREMAAFFMGGGIPLHRTAEIAELCQQGPCYGATDLTVRGNTFENLHGTAGRMMAAISVASCNNCAFVDNTVENVDLGIITSTLNYGDPAIDCAQKTNRDYCATHDHPNVKPPPGNLEITGNTFRQVSRAFYVFALPMEGHGVSEFDPKNDASRMLGATDGNIYCVDQAGRCESGEPQSACDNAYHHKLGETCDCPSGGGTYSSLLQFSTQVGKDLGDAYWDGIHDKCK